MEAPPSQQARRRACGRAYGVVGRRLRDAVQTRQGYRRRGSRCSGVADGGVHPGGAGLPEAAVLGMTRTGGRFGHAEWRGALLGAWCAQVLVLQCAHMPDISRLMAGCTGDIGAATSRSTAVARRRRLQHRDYRRRPRSVSGTASGSCGAPAVSISMIDYVLGSNELGCTSRLHHDPTFRSDHTVGVTSVIGHGSSWSAGSCGAVHSLAPLRRRLWFLSRVDALCASFRLQAAQSALEGAATTVAEDKVLGDGAGRTGGDRRWGRP